MLFCFGRTSLFCRSCASELNNTTASSRNDINKSTSQGVDSCPSSFNSTSSPYFCAIVAVIEVDFGRWHLPILDFREFQKCEAQSKASQAKLCIRGRNAEVDMFAALHLVAVWGSMVVGALGNKSCRRLRMEKSTPRKSYRLPSSICHLPAIRPESRNQNALQPNRYRPLTSLLLSTSPTASHGSNGAGKYCCRNHARRAVALVQEAQTGDEGIVWRATILPIQLLRTTTFVVGTSATCEGPRGYRPR